MHTGTVFLTHDSLCLQDLTRVVSCLFMKFPKLTFFASGYVF